MELSQKAIIYDRDFIKLLQRRIDDNVFLIYVNQYSLELAVRALPFDRESYRFHDFEPSIYLCQC